MEDIVEYESRLNYTLPNYSDPVICTYDLSRFSAGVAMDILRTHPMVILGGVLQENPLYVPPDEFLEELKERRGALDRFVIKIEAIPPTTKSLALRRATRDLAALATLPAIWISSDLNGSLQNLAEVLSAAVRARFVFIRVTPSPGQTSMPRREIPCAHKAGWWTKSASTSHGISTWTGTSFPATIPSPEGEASCGCSRIL